jgi:hypothetical protein
MGCVLSNYKNHRLHYLKQYKLIDCIFENNKLRDS